MRLQQSGIEPRHTPGVFGAALLDEAAKGETVEEDARLGCRKILAVIGAATLPDGSQ